MRSRVRRGDIEPLEARHGAPAQEQHDLNVQGRHNDNDETESREYSESMDNLEEDVERGIEPASEEENQEEIEMDGVTASSILEVGTRVMHETLGEGVITTTGNGTLYGNKMVELEYLTHLDNKRKRKWVDKAGLVQVQVVSATLSSDKEEEEEGRA